MQDIIQGLHPLERKIIPFLKNTMLFQELLEQTKMQEAEVMRALQWMENKELLKIKTETKETITFGDLGKKYSHRRIKEKGGYFTRKRNRNNRTRKKTAGKRIS